MSEHEIIRIAAEAGARAAIETLEKERLKAVTKRADKRIRNTKLLLKNYRMFKKHCTNSIYKAKIKENTLDILDLMYDPNNNSEMVVQSIKKSAMRTKIIIMHIDEMLKVYDILSSSSDKLEDARRYRVLNYMYISEKKIPAEEIAEIECIDVRTVYKDLTVAIERLGALIFGVDSLS